MTVHAFGGYQEEWCVLSEFPLFPHSQQTKNEVRRSEQACMFPHLLNMQIVYSKYVNKRIKG
jgi:hypothetical protein